MTVRFTASAQRQFLAALRYIQRENPPAAVALRLRAEQQLRRLEEFPDSGRRIPEFPDLPYREMIIQPYRFFHRAEEDVIWIVAVWHSAQLPGLP